MQQFHLERKITLRINESQKGQTKKEATWTLGVESFQDLPVRTGEPDAYVIQPEETVETQKKSKLP